MPSAFENASAGSKIEPNFGDGGDDGSHYFEKDTSESVLNMEVLSPSYNQEHRSFGSATSSNVENEEQDNVLKAPTATTQECPSDNVQTAPTATTQECSDDNVQTAPTATKTPECPSDNVQKAPTAATQECPSNDNVQKAPTATKTHECPSDNVLKAPTATVQECPSNDNVSGSGDHIVNPANEHQQHSAVDNSVPIAETNERIGLSIAEFEGSISSNSVVSDLVAAYIGHELQPAASELDAQGTGNNEHDTPIATSVPPAEDSANVDVPEAFNGSSLGHSSSRIERAEYPHVRLLAEHVNDPPAHQVPNPSVTPTGSLSGGNFAQKSNTLVLDEAQPNGLSSSNGLGIPSKDHMRHQQEAGNVPAASSQDTQTYQAKQSEKLRLLDIASDFRARSPVLPVRAQNFDTRDDGPSVHSHDAMEPPPSGKKVRLFSISCLFLSS